MPVFFCTHETMPTKPQQKKAREHSKHHSFYYTAQAHLDSGTFRANTLCPISVAHQQQAFDERVSERG
jgi:hypothetical protein